MHESGMIEDLIAKVEALARQNSAHRVLTVEVSIGPLAAIEADHLREHFVIASKGTLAEGAEFRLRPPTTHDPQPAAGAPSRDPFGVYLESVELET